MLSRTRVESTDVPEACSLFPFHNSDEKVKMGEKGDNSAFVTQCTLLLSVEITDLKVGKSKGLFFAQFISKSHNFSSAWCQILKEK